MSRKQRFLVGELQGLEPRLVMSAGVSRAAAEVAGLANPGRGSRARSNRAEPQISLAFDRFRADYFGAQSIYLGPANNNEAGTAAFENLVTQRVNFLAQDLSKIYLGLQGRGIGKNEQPQYRNLIQNRILSTNPGGLLGGLRAAMPPAGTTAQSAALYSLTAESTIGAAEVSALNGVRILRGGLFTGGKGHDR